MGSNLAQNIEYWEAESPWYREFISSIYLMVRLLLLLHLRLGRFDSDTIKKIVYFSTKKKMSIEWRSF